MNDLPRQKLRELVARHGRALGEDARRCKGLLLDYCAGDRREVAVLTMAVEERVPADLLAAPAGTPREVVRARLARRLCDHLALSEPAARWAVDSWALALGLMMESELVLNESQAMPPPPVPRAPTQPTTVAAPPRAASPATANPAARVAAKRAAQPVKNGPAPIIVAAGGAGDYATITEALQSAVPGARILIRPGLYDEALVIDKRVALLGDGRRDEIIVTSTVASCVRLAAAQATINGLTLRGFGARTGAAFFAVEVTQGKLLVDQCDISSDTLSCVAVHGAAAQASLRNCRIHDGGDSGVYVFEEAQATVEACDLYGHANIAVAVTGHAQVTLKRSHIHDGQNAGVVAWQQGVALIDECEIYGNLQANIGASEGGSVTVRASQIYRGENSGVYVHEGGEAKVEHCDIFEHRLAEVAVTTRGSLLLHDSQLHDSRYCGLVVSDEGQALVQECGLHSNALSGALLGAGASVAIHHCQLNNNGEFGVQVEAGGAVNVEESDLSNNYLGAWDVALGAIVESERNRE